MSRPLRIAVAQYQPNVGDVAGNRDLAVAWAERGVEAGAQLIVLPELAQSGYVFESEDEAEATAEPFDASAYITALTGVARNGDCHIVSGFNEHAKSCRYNSAVLVGPSGQVAMYRKLHLFHNELNWFTSGEGLVVVDLPWGRLGIIICYDLWFSEPARALALAGAEVIAVPTNWVDSFKPTVYDERGWCQGDYVVAAAAAQNGVVMACADRVGVERGVAFLGASVIVGADGWPLAGPAGKADEVLLVADVDLEGVERARRRTPRNHLLGDRRPAAYNVKVVPAAP